MSYSLRVSPHSVVPGREVIDILDGDAIVGTIVPHGQGIRIISVHIDKVEEDTGEASIPPIPSLNVTFAPGPWRIEEGRVVKLGKH